ncbi:MAG: GIY-YIG nuclease family protein [Chthoniobacter sp.]|uniref:GIY-YIG nuclease family protein n=1 Tax=Chthoniobacter sp. TaxID=2510640 RepID=UPI0032AA28E2
MKDLFVYILTNERRTTLYIGVTNNLEGRLWQHQNDEGARFTRRYNLTVLIYYETYPDPLSAIAKEKQLKGWKRERKEALIATLNPDWENLGVKFGWESLVKPRGPSTPLHSAQDDREERAAKSC